MRSDHGAERKAFSALFCTDRRAPGNSELAGAEIFGFGAAPECVQVWDILGGAYTNQALGGGRRQAIDHPHPQQNQSDSIGGAVYRRWKRKRQATAVAVVRRR